MRLLFLSQGRTINDQISFHDSFKKATSNGEPIKFYNFPIKGFCEQHDGADVYKEILRLNRDFNPDVVFFQHFHGLNIGSPIRCIEALRASANHPIIIGSAGDLFQQSLSHLWIRRWPRNTLDLAVHADAFFMTSMGSNANFLVRKGAKNVIFLPLAHIWQNFQDWNCPNPVKKIYDVVMIGSIDNRLKLRNPIGAKIHSAHRKALADALWKRYGSRFALFGNGWGNHPAALGPVPFNEQITALRQGVVSVDSIAPFPEVYYASNRPFIIAGSGTALVQYYTPRIDKLLQDGTHADFVASTDEMITACDRILNMDSRAREQRSEETVKYIFEHHTRLQRVDTIISTVEAIQQHRAGLVSLETALRHVRMRHFLPQVSLGEEYSYCVANWQG